MSRQHCRVATLFWLLLVTASASAADATCSPLDNTAAVKSPVDLYPSVTACANEAKYEIAMEYFAIAGVYGRFDTYRVSDISSHQIVGILKDHALDEIAKENRDALQSLVGETAGDRERHARLCQRIDSLGPPTYEPTYMRLHGIDAILGTSSAPTVLAPAERAVAWKKALSTYLNCSIASPAS
jgi:hypothetical protein